MFRNFPRKSVDTKKSHEYVYSHFKEFWKSKLYMRLWAYATILKMESADSFEALTFYIIAECHIIDTKLIQIITSVRNKNYFSYGRHGIDIL